MLAANKEKHHRPDSTRRENYIVLYNRHILITIKMVNASIICRGIDNFGCSKARLVKIENAFVSNGIQLNNGICLYVYLKIDPRFLFSRKTGLENQ